MIDMRQTAISFMLSRNFSVAVDIDSVIDSVLYDMECGIKERGKGKIKGQLKSSMDMIPTWFNVPSSPLCNKRTIVIDAGGTNFRVGLVEFNTKGVPIINDFEKSSMPGTSGELSKKDFFSAIAKKLDHLKDKADTIAFCFSYGMTITKDHDGIAMVLSKEIKAPEVTGCKVGSCLKAALEERGWKGLRRIVMLNDTQAALLAGAVPDSTGSVNSSYSSYVGFILGTGMNVAYIEQAIPGIEGFDAPGIVVTEAGGFNKIARSDYDIKIDNDSINPGGHVVEKMVSGKYLGTICTSALKDAAREGLFSDESSKAIEDMGELSLKVVSDFADDYKANKGNDLGGTLKTSADAELAYNLIDLIFDRSARISAAIIASSVIRSGAGQDSNKPVCVVCDGTTYYKTHKIPARVESYLDECLTRKRGLYFKLVKRDNDITLGTAVAGASV